jgi:hypothetical protein
VESAPRAYKLKVSNVAPPISTMTGTSHYAEINLQASSFETETAGDYCHGGPHRRNGVPIDMDGSRDACAAVIAGPRVGEHLTSHHGRPERVVEFAIREQTGIGRDDGYAKLKHQSAVDKRA